MAVRGVRPDLEKGGEVGYMGLALVRFAGSGQPEIGVLDQGQVVPTGLSDASWVECVERWGAGDAELPAEGAPIPVERASLLPPITDSARVFCVAQNYPAHAAEAGGASPPRPAIFLKPPSAFVGHLSTVDLPAISSFFDYEGELAVVVGKSGRSIRPEAAGSYIAGYTIGNDGSARDLQPSVLADRFQVDWFAAKAFDRGSALGPGVVRRSDVREPGRLRIRTTHNGELVQDDVTSSMHHSIEDLLAFVSGVVGLLPGDVILTGTPAGVGKARGVAVADGDSVTVFVDGLGELRTSYAAAPGVNDIRGIDE
ncbi:fumarylacetoacetate hydrolase family protein [Kribbella sp. NPDC050124]|uniref:fumarylacetoacetate hydrolase family protein n=1 Tax=Kribbella sp. NPDC050124 TaxID=3364114 RepID=UPI0037AAC143